MGRKYTRDEFISLLNNKTGDIKLVGDYNGIFIDTTFQCNKNHIFSAIPHNILNRLSCPICSGRVIVRGMNDLWTVRPDVAVLLENREKGYINGIGSNHKENFICPECHKISTKAISKVVSCGFHCDYCSDSVSFPNKVLRYVLSNLLVDNICFEWSPDWLKPRKYDGYFELCGQSYVVEMDGGIGHGKDCKSLGVNGRHTQVIDNYKDGLAKQHKIKVIRIDCDYDRNETRFEYIKTNLLNSELSSIVDLSLISWDECLKTSLSSNIVTTAKLYNMGYNIIEISKLLNYSRCTIRGWLKQASRIELCSYSVETVHQHAHRKLPSNTTSVQQIDVNGNVVNTFISVAEAHRATGINNISAVLNGTHKSAGGFTWKKCLFNTTK